MTDAELLDGILRQLGVRPIESARLTGGAVNATFRVRADTGDPLVIRFPVDRAQPDEFPVELWASRAAEDAGIPTAPVLSAGREDDVPFIVLRYVQPSPEAPARPWTWLGRYARAVATIPLDQAPDAVFSRFGRDLPGAWRQHLAYNQGALSADDPLARDGAYPADLRPGLSALIAELDAQPWAFGLAHGDLAPRNLLSRGATEAPVLIDWGTAGTGPSPWTDARRVYQWAHCDGVIAEAEYAEFAAAAGLESAEATRLVRAMTALHLVDVTRWARERSPERYQEYVLACRRGLESLGLART